MKIKKTPFSIEIEFTPDEIRRMWDVVPEPSLRGLVIWLREKFNLDLSSLPKKKDKE